MNWDDVKIFVALVRAGNLSGAARALAIEHSTVARRIDGLEKALGLRLFDRLPRGWQLTAEGEQLFARAQRMAEQADAFLREAADGASLAGTVRLSAPSVLSSRFLVPKLAACRERWSAIALDLIGESRVVSLTRREADLAIRIGRPEEPGLATRPLGAMSFGVFAQRSYFDRHCPQQWQFIGYDESLRHASEQQWLEAFANGRTFAFRSNNLAALHEAARNGLGLAALPHYLAASDPALAQLEDGCRPAPRELWLVIHPDVRRSPRVRLIADLVAEIFISSASTLCPPVAHTQDRSKAPSESAGDATR